MNLLLLCYEFFKIGLFAVGGGMAAIPFLSRIAVAYPEWYTLEMLTDMIAVSESTPGPIGINMATYVGYTVAGIPGAILTTVSLIIPSIIIILLIAQALDRYNNSPLVQNGFAGLRPAVTGLIAAAGYSVLLLALLPGGIFDWRCLLLFAAMLGCIQWKKLKNLHPIVYIAFAAVVGIVLEL